MEIQSEGKHRSRRCKLDFSTESASHAWEERKGKWKFVTVFSILKEEFVGDAE